MIYQYGLIADTSGGGGEVLGMARTDVVTPKMRSAAIMAAGGASADVIAGTLGVQAATVKGWLQRDDVIALINEAVGRAAQLAAPQAQQVLIKQLSDGNAWVAQSAAREVLRQAAQAAGTAAATVTVQFGAMPPPAVPDPLAAAE